MIEQHGDEAGSGHPEARTPLAEQHQEQADNQTKAAKNHFYYPQTIARMVRHFCTVSGSLGTDPAHDGLHGQSSVDAIAPAAIGRQHLRCAGQGTGSVIDNMLGN